MRRFQLVLFCGVFAIAGCPVGMEHFDAIMISKVRTKAAFDFECEKDTVQVSKIDNGSYGASGCGKRATYVGKDSQICWSGNSESNLTNFCQVVSDTFAESKSK
jgi:hypothetical protein